AQDSIVYTRDQLLALRDTAVRAEEETAGLSAMREGDATNPSFLLSSWGTSDHNLVHLLPLYKPLVHGEPVVTHTVKKWTAETEEALKDCFNTTLWEELCDPYGEDINGLTHCITDYVNFCVENTVPTKTLRCFSNNKPWINPDIKALLKDKKRAFRSGDKDEMKVVQRKLRRKIREGKASYRRKMEV
ncbi:hypothetical protein NFI96_015512, partial [Prochilodus magdalenae]